MKRRMQQREALDTFEKLRLKLPWPLSDSTRARDYFKYSCTCGYCPLQEPDLERAEQLLSPRGEVLFKVWAYQQQKPLSPDETV